MRRDPHCFWCRSPMTDVPVPAVCPRCGGRVVVPAVEHELAQAVVLLVLTGLLLIAALAP